MDLFESENSRSHSRSDLATSAPLAERMRPQTVGEFIGHNALMSPGAPLRRAIETDTVPSLIFWGPPGSGKTTLARIIAGATNGRFATFSAVTSGIKEVKELLTRAPQERRLDGRKTYLFIDEIHRFNRAQQDAFLPYVESGDIILIGATTENPSFEVNGALLSRMRVYQLERLSDEDLRDIVHAATIDKKRGLGNSEIILDKDAEEFLVTNADGDARRALTLLEAAFTDTRAANAQNGGSSGDLSDSSAPTPIVISRERLREIHQRGVLLYDKSGDEHFNLISALHKTIRGGDPDAALYWLARMLSAGEDPVYIIRRLVRFASEDIGLADNQALSLAIAARDSYHFLGSPEGELAIAQLTIYLSSAPKSNSAYLAWKKAVALASENGSLPPPLDIRNAPTRLMKDLRYGAEYKYAHDFPDALTSQEYFPEALAGTRIYFPKEAGAERLLADYMNWYLSVRKQLKTGEPTSDENV